MSNGAPSWGGSSNGSALPHGIATWARGKGDKSSKNEPRRCSITFSVIRLEYFCRGSWVLWWGECEVSTGAEPDFLHDWRYANRKDNKSHNSHQQAR